MAPSARPMRSYRCPISGGRWRLMFARLRNGSPWSAGDLVDIHNLAAAAGYADIVAGEKRTVGDLRVAKRVTVGARLATSLAEAVTIVDGLPLIEAVANQSPAT